MRPLLGPLPAHNWQAEISISNTRLSRIAQLSGGLGSACSTEVSLAVCIVGVFDLLRDGFAEPGNTAQEFGRRVCKFDPWDRYLVQSNSPSSSRIRFLSRISSILRRTSRA